MIYRRRKHSDVWHFMPQCRWWPTSTLKPAQSSTKPQSGEFCNECLAKAKR